MTLTSRVKTFVVEPGMVLVAACASSRKRVFYTFDGVTKPRNNCGLRLPSSPGFISIVDESRKPRTIYVKMMSASGTARVTVMVRPL